LRLVLARRAAHAGRVTDDGPAGPADADELLSLGGSRAAWLGRIWSSRDGKSARPRGWLAVAMALGTAIALWLSTSPGGHRPAATQPAAQNFARISISAVRGLTEQHGPLVVYIRQTSPPGACAVVAVHDLPAARISRALRAAFPGYVVTGSGRTLDEYSGLCELELRASHAGAVLVIRVTSPTAHAERTSFVQLETGIETIGALTTKYALALSPNGWTVLVGATGPNGALPRAADLVRVAQDPALRW
jgi:hypothetical protein